MPRAFDCHYPKAASSIMSKTGAIGAAASAAIAGRLVVASLAATFAARGLAVSVAWLNGHAVTPVAAGRAAAGWLALGWGALPAVGAVTAGLLLWRTVGRAGVGTGTDVYIAALRGNAPCPTWRLALVKLGATVLTVGSGGSGGLIGPALLIGAGMASPAADGRPVGRAAAGRAPDLRLAAAGAAAALATIWGVPWAAAMLACEVIYRQGVAWRLLPSAATGALVGWGASRLFWPSAYGSRAGMPVGAAGAGPLESLLALLPAAAAVALGGAFLGVLLAVGIRRLGPLVYDRAWPVSREGGDGHNGGQDAEGVNAGGGTGRVTRRQPWLAFGILAIGGFVAALAARQAGHGVLGFTSLANLVEWANGPSAGWPDLGLATGKLAATVATVGSGGSGGVVGPALHIGAALARGVASLSGGCATLLSAVGMAACLSAVSNVPLAATILMAEVLGLAALPYSALGAAAGFALARGWVAYASLDERGARTS